MEKHELTEIIRKAKAGDQEAFEQLVHLYKGHVFRQAMAMVHDRMEAEDITQEAFVKVYFSLAKLDREYAFVSWLTRIVSNLCYDRLKKSGKEKATEDTSLENLSANEQDLTIDHTETRLTVEEGLQSLSTDHREVIVLRDIQGFSYQEMAKIIKIPLGTVKSRINLARQELKRVIIEGEA